MNGKRKVKGKIVKENAICIQKNQISSNCHDEIISQYRNLMWMWDNIT